MRMAESYSVVAVLSAKDNMSSAFERAAGATQSFGGKLKSAIGLGAAMQIGMKVVNATLNTMTSHLGDAISRYDQLNNFPKIMGNLGISAKDANGAVKELSKGIDGLPTTLDAATMGVTRFTSKNGDVKKSTKYFLALNNAVIAGGQSAEIQSTAVEQLSQAYSKGKMDMVEWRSLQTAMPGQLNQIAKAMGKSTDELGEGLRNGTISMDEFMDTIVRLNEEGVDGFASFADQAKTSIGGIGTAMNLVGSAITRGLANCIGAIDKMLAKNGMPNLSEITIKARDKINDAFKTMETAISKVNLEGIVKGATPYWNAFKSVAGAAGKVIKKAVGFLNEHAEAVTRLVPAALGLGAAFSAYNKISMFIPGAKSLTQIFSNWGSGMLKKVAPNLFKTAVAEEAVGKAGEKGGKGLDPLKEGLGSLAKSGGIALIIGSLALLALAFKPLASLGTTAIAPLLTFGVVVGGLAAVFSTFGTKLQASMYGILAFSGSISMMALAMAPITSSGLEGAAAMAAFGIVVAGLVVVFSTFGTALNIAVPGMLALGASMLMAGAGMALASVLVKAMTAAMRTAGSVIVSVADAVSSGFSKICDAVSNVIGAISGGFTSILNSIAGVIQSVGISARNAGEGFKSVAVGIKLIASIPIGGILKSLGAVAAGMASISSQGKNLPQVASGMQNLVMAISVGAGGISVFNSALMMMSSAVTNAVSSVTALKAAFSNFVIPSPNVGPFITAFNQIILSSKMIIPALTASGRQAGIGLASGLSAGAGKAKAVISALVTNIASSVRLLTSMLLVSGRMAGIGFSNGLKAGLAQASSISAKTVAEIISRLNTAASGARSAGRNIGLGLANGMLSTLGTVRKVAAQLASAAEAAIRAKAQIHSPSKVSDRLGAYYGGGFVGGIASKIKEARKMAERLVNIPNVIRPKVAFAGMGYDGALSDEFSYGGNSTYVIEVPVEVDGRTIAKVTAPYTEAELKKLESRESRKRGKR